ncbi:MAG: AAA family ATPase, partial [Planctomycetales bacterium]|nr:AAA family ATPase [Planctomycetales bacterium]
MDFIDLYIISLQEQIRMNEARIGVLSEDYTTQKEIAGRIAATNFELEELLKEQATLDRLSESVQSNLQAISASNNKEGFNFEITYPPSSAKKVKPDLTQSLALGAFLGILAGLGLAYAVDMADRTFHSPDEVSRALQLPILGHMPKLVNDKKQALKGSNVAPTIIAHHKSRSRNAEAVRAVRTSIFFNNRELKHKVIQVTSPHAGDGKSTLTANLAVSIAQAGKRVLLIDADLGLANVDIVMGLKPKATLADLFDGSAELTDLLVPGPGGVTVLPASSGVQEMAYLTDDQILLFMGALEELDRDFDILLVDTGAGIGKNVLYFNAAAQEVMVV